MSNPSSCRKVRTGLDKLLDQCKAMPARLRSYSAYDYVTKQLKSYIKVTFLTIMAAQCTRPLFKVISM